MIKDVLSGIQIESIEPELDKKKTLHIPDLAGMYVWLPPRSITWQYSYAKTAQAYEPDLVKEHIQKPDSAVIARRNEILRSLEACDIFEPLPVVTIDPDEAARKMELDVTPLECGLGMLPQYPKD